MEKEDNRAELKGLLGKKVDVVGSVEFSSWTKGSSPRKSFLVKDIVVSYNGVHTKIDHAWLMTDALVVDEQCYVECVVVEYMARSTEGKPFLKLGFGHISRSYSTPNNTEWVLSNLQEIRSKSKNNSNSDKDSIEKMANDNNPIFAIKSIRETMMQYGINITPEITESGHWHPSIVKNDGRDQKKLLAEQSFPIAVAKAKEMVEMLAPIKNNLYGKA